MSWMGFYHAKVNEAQKVDPKLPRKTGNFSSRQHHQIVSNFNFLPIHVDLFGGFSVKHILVHRFCNCTDFYSSLQFWNYKDVGHDIKGLYAIFVVYLSSRDYKKKLFKKKLEKNNDGKRHLYFSKHLRGLVKLCCKKDLSPTSTVWQAIWLNSKGTNCIDALQIIERSDWSLVRWTCRLISVTMSFL